MERASVPYCVVAKVVFSSLRTMSVSEQQAAWLVDFGWHVLIRESDMTSTEDLNYQSNPRRHEDDGEDGA